MGADIEFNACQGHACRIIASLYKQAQKQNAVVELSEEDEFRIWRLQWKLKTLLELGRPVSIKALIPFEEGGVFHPANLKVARLRQCADQA